MDEVVSERKPREFLRPGVVSCIYIQARINSLLIKVDITIYRYIIHFLLHIMRSGVVGEVGYACYMLSHM